MSRVFALSQRYATSARFVKYGVELVAVGDPTGARFDLAVRRLISAAREDGSDVWNDLAGVCRLLRWRLITQPQPLAFQQELADLTNKVSWQAERLRGAIANQDLLDEIMSTAAALVHQERESVVGEELLNMCLELEADSCVVVAANSHAKLGLVPWLEEYGIKVMTAKELERERPDYEQAYVVGPPRFFGPPLLTASVTDEVTFVLPAWFADRRIPCSAIAAQAEGAVRIEARIHTVGDTSVSEPNASIEAENEDMYLPQPIWNTQKSEDRDPTNDKVNARKILLSGGLAIWLDDGERIRSLDPQQPMGERISYTEVAAVRKDTYLLLRTGEIERGVLYEDALVTLRSQGRDLAATQEHWKEVLSQRLQQRGHQRVVQDLCLLGVKATDQVQAWVDPRLIRPKNDQDFSLLLKWLGIPIYPTFDNASLLRKEVYRASAEIRRQLENSISIADLTELERVGHLRLQATIDSLRGILASRVVAISPYRQFVPSHDTRILFEDRGGRWLE